MARVLIVDDEEIYRSQIELTLAGQDHEVRTASRGREAVDVGVRFRPEILITDWMLKNHLHGLHVVDVLRAVDPALRAILITGFTTGDLRGEARKKNVFAFIEKPFERDEILAAIAAASDAARNGGEEPRLGLIELDRDGRILGKNAKARKLFARTRAGEEASHVGELFPAGAPDFEAAVERWVVVAPDSDSGESWELRCGEPEEGASLLVVVRSQDEKRRARHALVEMLLGFREPRTVRWPFEGRVLVLDDEILIRRMLVSTLESAGAGCYAVESIAEALRLLRNDEGIGYVVHDFEMPATDIADSIRQIHELRPDVVVVGSSGRDHRHDFADLGVEHFLHKPWRVSDLISMLSGRIVRCVDCGLPLPLRRPKPGEDPLSWICAGCGARYAALLDDDAEPDDLYNVHPAPRP